MMKAGLKVGALTGTADGKEVVLIVGTKLVPVKGEAQGCLAAPPPTPKVP